MAIKRRKTKRKATGGGRSKAKGRASAVKRVSRPARKPKRSAAAVRPPSRPGGKRP